MVLTIGHNICFYGCIIPKLFPLPLLFWSTELKVIFISKFKSPIFQVGKEFELMNCDKHKNVAKKFKRDISTCRPDITHQVYKAFFNIIVIFICESKELLVLNR